MIVSLLQSSILAAINDRRSGALETPYPAPATVLYEDISDNVFDIVDVKGTGGSIKRVPATGLRHISTETARAGMNCAS